MKEDGNISDTASVAAMRRFSPVWTPAVKNLLMRARVIAQCDHDEYVGLDHIKRALEAYDLNADESH